MAKFAVYVIESNPVAAFGIHGERVTKAHFRIQSSSGDCHDYTGTGQGAEFADNCKLLMRSPVFLETLEANPKDVERWKEDVIQRAMRQLRGRS